MTAAHVLAMRRTLIIDSTKFSLQSYRQIPLFIKFSFIYEFLFIINYMVIGLMKCLLF